MNRLDRRYHIGFWIVKIAIIFVFFHLPTKNDNSLFWIASPLIISFHIGYFYGIYSYLFPKFFKQKKFIEFIIGSALLSLLHCTGLLWVWSDFSDITQTKLAPHVAGFFGANFIFFAISFTWRYLDYLINEAKQKHFINRQFKNSELSFLKAQINPHFLFNVLGCINGLSITNSPKTAFAIQNFNQLIKASSQMKGGQKINLKNELTFLKSYINLQEMRHRVPVNVETPDLSENKLKIEPLLLIPLIENVFTHGDVTDEGFVSIKFSLKENILSLSVRNMISKSSSESEMNTGFNNLKNRLQIVYPGKFELSNKRYPDNFISTLAITLND